MVKLFCHVEKSVYFCTRFQNHKYCNINLKTKNKMAHKITDICVACGSCINECPVGAISEGDIYKIDENACVDCGTCVDACPTGAIVAG